MTRTEFHERRAYIARVVVLGMTSDPTRAAGVYGMLDMIDPDDRSGYPEPVWLVHRRDAEDAVEAGLLDPSVLDQEEKELDFSDLFKPQYGWLMPVHPDHF